jgi:putative phage-type endonuclease
VIVQGTPEWFAQRCGRVTASRVGDVIATTKSGYSTSRENYMAQLIAERLTGNVEESYTNAAMQWGTNTEPQARAAYEFFNDVTVEPAEFVPHPTIPMCGASPDGLVGADGLLEVKAPNTATHLNTLLGNKVPEKHMPQIQWQMACTGRAWVDFMSFDPRLPSNMQMFVQRVPRQDNEIKLLETEIKMFLNELERRVAALVELRGAA